MAASTDGAAPARATAARASALPADIRAGRKPLEVTPPELVPDLLTFPATEIAYYRKAVILPPHAADPLTNPSLIDSPLSLGDISADDHGIEVPVEGVVLTHSQRWTRTGLALGNLLHSLALAPGEATRVAMEDWTHRTKGSADESTSQVDDSSATEAQDRSLSEIQNAVATESQHGSSMAVGTSVTSEAAFSFLVASASIASTFSLATAVSSSDASRNLGANENQQVHQAAEQHARAARTRRATVVREVVESDTATATTRIVANYNRLHAITMQYFEVVEVFDVETRVADVQPCIFVPLALMDGGWLLDNHPSTVADAAQAVGMDRMAAAIRAMTSEIPLKNTGADRASIVTDARTALDQATALVNTMSDTSRELGSVGVHMVPRIFPPPPPIPWSDADTAQVRQLANQLADTARQVLAALDGSRTALDGLGNPDLEAAESEADLRAKLVRRIDEHREYFNQAVWLRALTPRVVHLLLKDRLYAGELLNDILEPIPVAITGNLVAFPLASGKWLPTADEMPTVDLDHVVRSTIAIPTGGVFAEAVPGQAVAADRIDLTRFWNWQESPIPLVPTELKSVDLGHTPAGIDTSTGQVAASAAPIQPWTALPAPAGLGDLLTALSKGDMFRDMSGLDAARDVAVAAVNNSTSAAADAAKNQTESLKTFANLVETIVPMVLTDGASTIMGGLANGGGGAGSNGAASEPEAEPARPAGAGADNDDEVR